MKSIKSRTAQLQRKSEDAKAKAEQAQMRYERYVGHVRRLEEEVVAAKGHVEAARKDLEEHQQEALHAEDTLDLLEELRHIDDGLNAEVSAHDRSARRSHPAAIARANRARTWRRR